MIRDTIGVIAWVALAVVAGSFWFDHRASTNLVLAGLALHAYAIAGLASGLVMIVRARRLDYARPVVELQHELGAQRRFAAVRSLALGLPWWFLWIPCFQVLFGLIGVDIVAASPAWFWISMAVGGVGLAISLAIARRFANRPVASPAARAMIDSLTGAKLRRIARELDDLARFADEN